MIFMLSHNYYDSAASLNEMGAAWLAKTESTLVLLPGFSFSDIKGCIDSSVMGIALEGDINELKHRLGELKDNLCEEFKLSTMSATKWERYRDGFLGKIQSDVSKESIQEEKSDDSQLYIPTVENYNNETVSVETAFLLVYAAAGDGRILRLATLGAPVQVSAAGKQFMADNSQRESAIWQEALDNLVHFGWVKPTGHKGQVFEVTGTGYAKADWLKEGMCINTDIEPLDEIKNFDR